MQGFILSLQPVRDEDLWVSVLTSESLLSLYRFYGARHSVIALGHKIDFCTKTQGKRGILCLRDVLHLGFLWEEERGKKLVWQEFVRLLFAHLRDVEHIEDFYYALLCEMAHKMSKQNPHRIACEAYAKILAFEGRANAQERCFVCGSPLGARCALGRALLGICEHCLQGDVAAFETQKISYFLHHCDAMLLEDREITKLWSVVARGL